MPFRSVRGIAAVSLLMLVAIAAAYALNAKWFFVEDGVVEWASATLFLGAAYLAAISLLRSDGVADRIATSYVLLLSALCFLSEVSFGARMFGWDMPKMAGGGELDGGQDLVQIAITAEWNLYLYLVLPSLLAAVAAMAFFRKPLTTRILDPFVQYVRRESAFEFVLFASMALLTAMAVDIAEKWQLRILEESLELGAAMTLFVSQYRFSGRKAGRFAADPANRSRLNAARSGQRKTLATACLSSEQSDEG
ncbi:hypothetical protein M0208_17710 [Sphingomonas sp. SUN019]|uniref:hypothetical protein n=1 Tax=Sphingomonas sp. SUN019 TaxID=2937788 RepID=UPI0021649B26|nr:hypothetical protein [Sphingomonas sp. SUN019]UVO52257.1 hypothetical protein M0208_17710 [Sphingomonas sp. SUN019]